MTTSKNKKARRVGGQTVFTVEGAIKNPARRPGFCCLSGVNRSLPNYHGMLVTSQHKSVLLLIF